MGSAWAEVPTITNARPGGGRQGPSLGAEPGLEKAGGTLPKASGDWRRKMRGGGARGVSRRANGSTEERAC